MQAQRDRKSEFRLTENDVTFPDEHYGCDRRRASGAVGMKTDKRLSVCNGAFCAFRADVVRKVLIDRCLYVRVGIGTLPGLLPNRHNRIL
jgi:hypothetical protein